MSDHEFEKKVQQTMGDLKLRPSDAVWMKVEKKIRRDKRRRRAIIWLPLALLGLSAGAYYLATGYSTKSPVSSNGPLVSSKSNSATQTNKTKKTVFIPSAPKADPGTSQPKTIVNEVIVHKDIKTKNPVTESQTDKKTGSDKINSEKEPQPVNGNDIAQAPVSKPETKGDTVVSNDSTTTAATSGDSAKTVAINEPLPAAKPEIVKVKKKKTKLQWGITVNSGVSNISQGAGIGGLFQKSRVEDLAYGVYGANSPSLSLFANARTNIKQPSAIQPGWSYSIGGYVQKQLKRSISLSAGLQYSYYSTNITVGNKVNNLQSVNIGRSGTQLVSQYYQNQSIATQVARLEQDYTNKFHFIELPVTLHMQLNKSRRMPVIWNAGVVVTRLLSTNALNFDGSTGVYYESDGLFNKTQLNLTTGFGIGIFQRSSHPVWIGPSLTYSATSLVKKQVSSGQYLVVPAINVKMALKK